MPGSLLNRTEKSLKAMWDSNTFGDHPTLKSIAIDARGDAGIRGIKSLRFELCYPVTFLTGQNGSGKSTLLALAALAYHGTPGHVASFAKSRTSHPKGDFTYYTFKDFFHLGPGDEPVTDVEISWSFDGRAKDISLIKKTDKWMRYERRPSRPVEYFGIARAVPSIELSILRNQFGSNASGVATAPLSPETRAIVEKILGRTYPNVEELNGKKSRIRRTGNDGYTSFNMGAGEDSLIALVAKLSQIPVGSLVVIDEIETTLHPAAQRKLATAIIELALERRLQVIGSTHSHHFLDCLPRIARAMVLREGDAHRIVSAPTTSFALTELSGQQHKELVVICEDQFAACLINNCLSASVRKRLEIHACGSKNELARYARSHLRVSSKSKCLIVWDGDVSLTEAKSFIEKASSQIPDGGTDIDARLSWTSLPGTVCPEMWALDAVRTNGLAKAAESFGFESLQQTLQALSECGNQDVHSIPFELAQQTGLGEVEAANRLISCASLCAKTELDPLINFIHAQLG